jgi:DNA primase
MAPHPAPPELSRRNESQGELAALRARLLGDAQTLRTPGDWASCLRLAALMPGEDFANILLIASQRPGATMVRDHGQWTAAGRRVRRREKGIETFRIPPRSTPARPQDRGERDDDQPQPTWRDANRVGHVWDLSQTTGQPVTAPAGLPPPGQAPAGLWDALCWLARREGFAVEREYGPPADGTTFWAVRRIRVPPDLAGEQATWALTHQLGHILLHNRPGGYVPGVTTTDCTGMHKAEADSVAYITCARYGVTPGAQLAYPASWAGSDPRAQPAATILGAGHRITTAAAHIIRHTDRILRGDEPATANLPLAQSATPTAQPRLAQRGAADAQSTAANRPADSPSAKLAPSTRRILRHAHDFYANRLAGSWASGYLESRSIGTAVAAEWGIGYAPAGWTALTDQLRDLGHSDDEIEAAGIAKRSSRGTLIDRFRDRVVLPVHDERGEIAGFIGRAHPDAPKSVPKYLNSPDSAAYKKGNLLFGLHQGRAALAREAVPVIVEGPFDAIAVSLADPGHLVGLAPCGTALTARQAELISQAADLTRTGILVAFDADTAGRNAAVRAYGILRPHTPKLQTARLNAKDPAKILEQDGTAALRAILRDHREPLSAVVIDAHIGKWDRHLDHIEGRYRAMHSTAALIAELLPVQAVTQVSRITAGRDLVMVDDVGGPVDNPELSQIAATLPGDAAYQIMRAAGALGFDVSEVLAQVANAVTHSARSPKGREITLRETRVQTHPASGPEASQLADTSFPLPPLSAPADAVRTGPGPRLRPQASGQRQAAHR